MIYEETIIPNNVVPKKGGIQKSWFQTMLIFLIDVNTAWPYVLQWV